MDKEKENDINEEIDIEETQTGEYEVELTNTEEESEDTSKSDETVEKTFTQKELDAIIEKRVAREQRIREKELEKYKKLEKTLSAGMGEEDIDKITSQMKDYYKENGIDIPEEKYSERDEKILAKAYAQEIIELGFDEMEAEANRIASIPKEKRSIKESVLFDELCTNLVKENAKTELSKKGIDTSILENEDFKKFASKFNQNTSLIEIHDLYSNKTKTSVEKPASTGSVKSTSNNNAVKDFYTYEESLAFTKADFDKNPKLYKAVENSMTKW